MIRRSLAVLAAVAALLGCSDDDAGTTSSSTVQPSPVAVEGVELEGRPSALAWSDGVLWVADDGGGVVWRYDGYADPDAAALGPPVPVGAAPVALDVRAGTVWVADASGVVIRIDVATAELVGLPIDLGGALVDVVVDETIAWVGDIEASRVHAIDIASGIVRGAIAVPDGVVRLALVDDELWVTGLDDSVTPIARTGEVGAPIEVGQGPIGLAATANAVWVANSDDDTVTRVPLDGGRTTTIAVGDGPVAVGVLGRVVWVANQDAASLTRIDATTGDVIGEPVELGFRPRDMVATTEGIWVVGVDPSGAVFVRRA